MKITIPKPCHEDWNKMTPKEQGSFCSSCAKIVVDFTKMKKEEIKQYFIDKKEEKTCGRFTINQLYKKPPVYERSYLSKFAFALYVVFGMTLFSCAQEHPHFLMGKVLPPKNIDTLSINLPDTIVLSDTVIDTSKKDTLKHIEPQIMGDVIMEPEDFELGQPTIIIEEQPIKEQPPKVIKMGKVMIKD